VWTFHGSVRFYPSKRERGLAGEKSVIQRCRDLRTGHFEGTHGCYFTRAKKAVKRAAGEFPGSFHRDPSNVLLL
jgi:hypothetical protein